MSPAHVFEPTYEAIKRRLMTGEWASGTRIEAARLADDFGVSVTPVRDSLYRLNGERMVDFTPGEAREIPVFSALQIKYGRVSAEHFLSQQGLADIHMALGGDTESEDVILARARDGDARAREAVSIFSAVARSAWGRWVKTPKADTDWP